MRHEALHAYIQERMHQPFAWGRHDCFLLAADWVHALTGRDPAQGLRGRYATARDALRLLRAEGGMLRLCTARIGLEVLPGSAADGDVLLLRTEVCDADMREHGALALRWGPLAMAQGAGGLVALPLDAATHAWRVA